MSDENITFENPEYTVAPVKKPLNSISIGAFSVIEASPEGAVVLGNGVTIGHHVTLRGPVQLDKGVEIRDYGSVGAGSTIGAFSKLLYGGSVYRDVTIGKNCIIGGSVDSGTTIGNDVTFLGRILHNYRTPGTYDQLTDGVPTPSPKIADRAVVGEGAMIVGNIEIGEGAYVAAGMVVKCNVPAGMLYCDRGLIPLSRFHGFVSAREERS